MPALTALLRNIVDYAGLFPPAGLELPKVVENYAEYTLSPHSWILGRLIIPVKQLASFAELARPLWEAENFGERLPWNISCLLPAPDTINESFAKAWEVIVEFNSKNQGLAIVDAVETKADSPESVRLGAAYCEQSINVFWELPHAKPLVDSFSAILAAGPNHRAKIRTGGVQARLIAPAREVAQFLSECAVAEVAFKATAGLHHPIRNEYALTYEPNSECATMHGFLNVFVAAVMGWTHKLSAAEVLPILSCRDPLHFEFREDAVVWRDLQATVAQVEAARNNFAISFGSCSFGEPIEDLQRLNFLAQTKELTR